MLAGQEASASAQAHAKELLAMADQDRADAAQASTTPPASKKPTAKKPTAKKPSNAKPGAEQGAGTSRRGRRKSSGDAAA